MTKWKSLAGKFTSDELEIIKDFRKTLELNENQFVRASIMMMIFFFGSLIKLDESFDAEHIDKKYQKLWKKTFRYSEFNEIQPALKAITDYWEQSFKEIIKENEPKIEKFTKKRKVGRPKAPKKIRGRPKHSEN